MTHLCVRSLRNAHLHENDFDVGKDRPIRRATVQADAVDAEAALRGGFSTRASAPSFAEAQEQ
jgi:hypothetical protein